jgi:acyl-CoA thioester hydrolase
MIEAEVIIEIPFHDVDIGGVAWHGHYVKYLEIARCALLEKFDYNYPQMKASGYTWPVIDLRIRYPRPVYFQQKVRVKARLDEWENRLKISYLIEDLKTSQRLTKAYTVQVAVDMKTAEMQYTSPDILYQKLGITI